MDPNKTLEQIRALAKYIGDHDYDALVDLVNSLDSWLSKGGFLPDRWKGASCVPVDTTAQLRRALHEINQSLHEAEEALHDARTILNIKLPHR